MELAKALDVRRGVTAIIGAGGKTTLLLALARELAAYSRGLGRMTVRFDGYDICHNPEEVIARRAYDAGADKENDADSVFCAKGAGFAVHWDKADEWMHCEVEEEP